VSTIHSIIPLSSLDFTIFSLDIETKTLPRELFFIERRFYFTASYPFHAPSPARYVARGDANAQESPRHSPGIAKNATGGSPSPLPSNVVFIDEIPLDFDVAGQPPQQQQPKQQQHATVMPDRAESKKAKCFGAPRCNVM
jgi:hypothetical protein